MGFRWLLLAAAFLIPVHADELLFAEDFQNGISKEWKKVEFTGETEHSIQREGTNAYVQAKAINSASGLAVKLESLAPEGTRLRWRWKIDHIPQNGSDTDIKTFDHTTRLFVAFKTLIGPPKTINYVWGNQLPAGKTFEHPSSGRSRLIVLQLGNANAGQWINEERDLVVDWKLLFGNDRLPAIVGLGFMTDSDGTKTTVTGCYDDIALVRRK